MTADRAPVTLAADCSWIAYDPWIVGPHAADLNTRLWWEAGCPGGGGDPVTDVPPPAEEVDPLGHEADLASRKAYGR